MTGAEEVAALPRRIAHVLHALLESSGAYALGSGPKTAAEVVLYDSEAPNSGATLDALKRAMLKDLCVGTFSRPRLWIPANRTIEMRAALEARFLRETDA